MGFYVFCVLYVFFSSSFFFTLTDREHGSSLRLLSLGVLESKVGVGEVNLELVRYSETLAKST